MKKAFLFGVFCMLFFSAWGQHLRAGVYSTYDTVGDVFNVNTLVVLDDSTFRYSFKYCSGMPSDRGKYYYRDSLYYFQFESKPLKTHKPKPISEKDRYLYQASKLEGVYNPSDTTTGVLISVAGYDGEPLALADAQLVLNNGAILGYRCDYNGKTFIPQDIFSNSVEVVINYVGFKELKFSALYILSNSLKVVLGYQDFSKFIPYVRHAPSYGGQQWLFKRMSYGLELQGERFGQREFILHYGPYPAFPARATAKLPFVKFPLNCSVPRLTFYMKPMLAD